MSTEALNSLMEILENEEKRLNNLTVITKEAIRSMDLVLEENQNMKDENIDLEEERDKYFEALIEIKRIVEET